MGPIARAVSDEDVRQAAETLHHVGARTRRRHGARHQHQAVERDVRPRQRIAVCDVSAGAHVRVRFLHPEHPIAYGYPAVTYAFRSNFHIYDPPKRWTTMSYCTSCLDGPFDFQPVVLQWGTATWDSDETTENMIVSGGGKKVEELEGRPAILDVPEGKGHVIAFNFNPMHRDMNHSDFRYLWNSIINWQYITSLNSASLR